MRIFLVAVLLFLSSHVEAQTLPPFPKGGLTPIGAGPCSDVVTGQHGFCLRAKSTDGTVYLLFSQEEVLMFIRKLLPSGSYTTIWQRNTFNAY